MSLKLRKYNKKNRPKTPEEFEDYQGRRVTFWLFLLVLIGYALYLKFK